MISVVLLTRNGGRLLQSVLERLATQSSAEPIEIVAIDSGSDDDSVAALERAGARVAHIASETFRFGPVREQAFRMTRGHIIVTLSQDVLPFDNEYIRTLIDPIIRDRADVVQGRTQPPVDCSVFYWERMNAFRFTSEVREYLNVDSGIGLSCCSLAIRRSAWEATGFGEAPFAEDKHIQQRLQRAHFRITILNEPSAWHGHRYSLLSIMKRCHNEVVGLSYLPGKYTLGNLTIDIFLRPWSFRREWLSGVLSGANRDPASLLFFQIRPVFFFTGNRILRRYWP